MPTPMNIHKVAQLPLELEINALYAIVDTNVAGDEFLTLAFVTQDGVTYQSTDQITRGGGRMYGPIQSLREYPETIGNDGVLNVHSANYFSKTVTANMSFSLFEPIEPDNLYICLLELTNGGAWTIDFWTPIHWPNNVPPLLSASGTDVIALWTRDGTKWFGKLIDKNFTNGIE